ncbi:SF3 helicase domain-containing protein [Trichonephila clavata]|uniref:SF3 helicase domain-containing protein n=1 Tax=Trichonephila clavata TaxID=2740835 RepID=A0A8X6HPD9_TRICU|nr:SF3 helicase domain-containing protein [Trichonephila clavata]
MGYRNSICECGPNLHLDPNDETSPCVVERSRIENGVFIGAVECMTNFSWKMNPIFCPHDEGMLSFSTPVLSSNSFEKMVSHLSIEKKPRGMSAYLHKVDSVKEAPTTDAYLLYTTSNEVFTMLNNPIIPILPIIGADKSALVSLLWIWLLASNIPSL